MTPKLKPPSTRPVLISFATAFYLLVVVVHALYAADSDLKPGDTVGAHNWHRVQGMVGENLLNRIKQGYTFKIKQPTITKPPSEYLAATEKYSGQVKLGRKGDLINYVAGLPFPNLSQSDPQAGLKLAWNYYWRWLGDDMKVGGGTEQGRIARFIIEKNGSERRADVLHHTIKTRGRTTLDPKPVLPGYEHIDWMQLRADEYPRDTSGTTTLEIRYADPDRADDLYVYVPSIRRVRRAPPIQRCTTIAPSEFTFDDINLFNGKITDFNYRILARNRFLANFSQERIPFYRKSGDYLPLKESWEIVDAYVLEITPKDPTYCYSKKIIPIEADNHEALWGMMWDQNGNYWKELIGFRKPVELPDGREVQSVASVFITNVQNGRSTVIDAVRTYNNGYQASLFTLATLQTVMRGGSIR